MPTKVEIEAKMKLADPDALRSRLGKLKAKSVGEHLELNMFFDTPDGALKTADSGLRIRVVRGPEGKQAATITHKGPRSHGQLKSRPEIELTVSDPLAAARLFATLGYHRTLTFEKRRHVYEYGKCEIVIDELPYLGCYVEIEGADDETIMKVRDKLGLSKAPLIRSSYIGILEGYLAEHKIANVDITFEGAE
jgi:adenylate cyclase class 2